MSSAVPAWRTRARSDGCEPHGFIDVHGHEGHNEALGRDTVDNDQGFSSHGYADPHGELTLQGAEALIYAAYMTAQATLLYISLSKR